MNAYQVPSVSPVEHRPNYFVSRKFCWVSLSLTNQCFSVNFLTVVEVRLILMLLDGTLVI
jgi:hypothetical protein